MAKRILIVENNDRDRELLMLVLSTRGFAVDTTTDAQQATAFFEQRPPDLLVVDSDLPDINGWDFCEDIKHRDGGQSVPLLIVSAQLPMQSRLDGSCADDFLVKPFDDQKLLEKVHHLLAANVSNKTEEA